MHFLTPRRVKNSLVFIPFMIERKKENLEIADKFERADLNRELLKPRFTLSQICISASEFCVAPRHVHIDGSVYRRLE